MEYFGFTYVKDWKIWPVPEWMEWIYYLGGKSCLVAVGNEDQELSKLAKDFNVLLTYVKERDIRFMDFRAYYKLLAELTCSPGLKFMLDIDEFPIVEPNVEPERGKSFGIVHMPTTWDKAPKKEVLFFDKSRTTKEYEELKKEIPNIIPLNAYVDNNRQMARIFKGYTGVLEDGGKVELPLDTNNVPQPILNIIKNEKDIVKKSWAWKFGYERISSDDITKLYPLKWVKIYMSNNLSNILEKYRLRVSSLEL